MSEQVHILCQTARVGIEFGVMDKLSEAGIPHWRGERIEFMKYGGIRTAEPHTYPAWPGYIWAMPSVDQVALLHDVKHVRWRIIHPRYVSRMEAARDYCEQRLAEAKNIVGNRKAIAIYRQGDKLDIIDGPFAGLTMVFKEVAEHLFDEYPMVRGDVDMMGGVVPVEVPPLMVRRAE